MPVGAVLGGVASAVGAASGINSLVNSGGPGGGPGAGTPAGAGGGSPFLYQPTGQPQQDINLQNIINSQYGAATTQPQYALGQQLPLIYNLANTPWANPYITAASNAGQRAGGLAGQEQDAAGSLFGGGNRVMQTAMDPQKALYDRMVGQLTDQSNAVNSMYGLGSSPVGAGLTQNAISNFNIDWQNQQLQRQLAGLRGAGQAYAGGADVGQAGVSNVLQSGQIPYQAYGTILGNQINTLGMVPQAVSASFGPGQVTAGNIQSYLGLGQDAATAALNQQAQRFGQANYGAQTVSQNLGALAQLYGPNRGGAPGSYGANTGLLNAYGPSANTGYTGYGAGLIQSYG